MRVREKFLVASRPKVPADCNKERKKSDLKVSFFVCIEVFVLLFFFLFGFNVLCEIQKKPEFSFILVEIVEK